MRYRCDKCRLTLPTQSYVIAMTDVPALDEDLDSSTIWTDARSVIEGPEDGGSQSDTNRPSTPTPHRGRTFLIRSISSGDVITLSDGKVMLAQPDGRASHWVCEEANGWLGFRNVVSGKLLGRGLDWGLCCSVTWHKEWERFHVHQQPEGGSVLLMSHWFNKIRPIGMRRENGTERLAMIEIGESDPIGWEFVEV